MYVHIYARTSTSLSSMPSDSDEEIYEPIKGARWATR